MTTLFRKTKFVAAAALLTLAVSQQTSGANITFGGIIATDGSGITSDKVPANNMVNASAAGIFIETFDTATAVTGLPAALQTPANTVYNVPDVSTGCAINSPLGITTSTTDNIPRVMGVRTGTTANVAAAPAGDTTCYGYTTPESVGTNSWVDIDYSAFLTGAGLIDPSLAGSRIGYLGFYWGSVDNYNTFEFYSDTDLGTTQVAKITGPELLAAFNGQSGDQQAEESNQYVNVTFGPGEAFNRVRVLSSGIAGEFDNVVIQLVPAPASLAILGLGLLGLGLSRRFRK